MHDDGLKVNKLFQRIGIKASWVHARIYLALVRDGETIERLDLFGKFDHSYCQTDIILTQKDEIVNEAKPGDEYFLCYEN